MWYMYLYIYVAIETLCDFDNQWQPPEVSEMTNCSSYEYKNIQMLMIKVCDIVTILLI